MGTVLKTTRKALCRLRPLQSPRQQILVSMTASLQMLARGHMIPLELRRLQREDRTVKGHRTMATINNNQESRCMQVASFTALEMKRQKIAMSTPMRRAHMTPVTRNTRLRQVRLGTILLPQIPSPVSHMHIIMVSSSSLLVTCSRALSRTTTFLMLVSYHPTCNPPYRSTTHECIQVRRRQTSARRRIKPLHGLPWPPTHYH